MALWHQWRELGWWQPTGPKQHDMSLGSGMFLCYYLFLCSHTYIHYRLIYDAMTAHHNGVNWVNDSQLVHLQCHIQQRDWHGSNWMSDNKDILTKLWLLSLLLSRNSQNLASCIWMMQGQTHQSYNNYPSAWASFAARVKACPKEPTLWILASRLEEADGKKHQSLCITREGSSFQLGLVFKGLVVWTKKRLKIGLNRTD